MRWVGMYRVTCGSLWLARCWGVPWWTDGNPFRKKNASCARSHVRLGRAKPNLLTFGSAREMLRSPVASLWPIDAYSALILYALENRYAD